MRPGRKERLRVPARRGVLPLVMFGIRGVLRRGEEERDERRDWERGKISRKVGVLDWHSAVSADDARLVPAAQCSGLGLAEKLMWRQDM